MGCRSTLTPCPFDELFSQEGSSITGGNYLTGLLWALESLAWEEQSLVRVCVALAELASHDPGGQRANRPSNSLITILLPWMPQTLASIDKRKVAVQTIIKEQPQIAWNLLLQLLPNQHQISVGSYKPRWRNVIPKDDKKEVTTQEYWVQVSFYAELIVDTADTDIARLSILVNHLNNLTKLAFEKLINNLSSPDISALPEKDRLVIWNGLIKFANEHRKYSDTDWALPDEIITRIEDTAKILAPKNPFNLYQRLFTNDDFDLYEENSDWEQQRQNLKKKREDAILEIFNQNGMAGIIEFSESVSSVFKVGHALAVIDNAEIENTLLPDFLNATNDKHKELVGSFILQKTHIKEWSWCDYLDKSNWNTQQIAQFLVYSPFSKEAWDRVAAWLPHHESEYWSCANTHLYDTVEQDYGFAIEKLIEYHRPYAAINCLYDAISRSWLIDNELCVKALLATVSSNKSSHVIDGYHTVELIQHLQTQPSVNQENLLSIEWSYLPWLHQHYNGATPKTIENKLANDPDFFCEIIQLIYRSEKEDYIPKESTTEASKAIARNAYRLLEKWQTPPGTQSDGSFNKECFTQWLEKVKEICTESGHLEIALSSIGKVLIHAVTDSSGLWIHSSIAEALNERNAQNMRDGFRTGLYNSRGIHCVDPTGEPEKALARNFREKAEAVENEGFQRLATTLRELATTYEHEAERIIHEHED